MTELFLKKDTGDWQKVIFSTQGSGFKLTRENPYFTESESYTLDVSLPMDILENRQFFGNLQRIDTTKTSTKYQCRLMVDNKSMLDGTARVSQVTESTVKVQLLGGNSELKFLSKEEGAYIDEMDLVYMFDKEWWDKPNRPDLVKYMPVYDETNAMMVNEMVYNEISGEWYHRTFATAPQPNLIYVIMAVLNVSGYKIARCDIDREPWNRLYVASAKQSKKYSHALPHWRVGEFLSEICKFFNCTLTVDSNTKTVSIISNTDFFGSGVRTAVTPVDEYNAEMEEDDGAEALASSNIEYDMSSSSEHVTDILADDVRDAIPHRTYNSKSAAYQDCLLLGDERVKYIYVCPEGHFVWWTADVNGQTSGFMKKVDNFAPLVRDSKSDSSISLKICPVAMFYSTDALYYRSSKDNAPRMSCWVPSLENPTGHEPILGTDTEIVSAQDIIEGTESTEKAEKEDRLQVFFAGTLPQQSVVQSGPDKGKRVPLVMPLTDSDIIYNGLDEVDPWSLSLNPSDDTFYLGQLHNTAFTFKTKAKHTIKFIADTMPDPTAVFRIRGKLYGCEKIEANVTEEGFDKLMTGYFYEMS